MALQARISKLAPRLWVEIIVSRNQILEVAASRDVYTRVSFLASFSSEHSILPLVPWVERLNMMVY